MSTDLKICYLIRKYEMKRKKWLNEKTCLFDLCHKYKSAKFIVIFHFRFNKKFSHGRCESSVPLVLGITYTEVAVVFGGWILNRQMFSYCSIP